MNLTMVVVAEKTFECHCVNESVEQHGYMVLRGHTWIDINRSIEGCDAYFLSCMKIG